MNPLGKQPRSGLLTRDVPLKFCGVLQVGRGGYGWRRPPWSGERKTRKTERCRKPFPNLGSCLVTWVSASTSRMGIFIWESWDKAQHQLQRGSLGPALRNQQVGQRTGRWQLGPEAGLPGFSGILQPLECAGRAANGKTSRNVLKLHQETFTLDSENHFFQKSCEILGKTSQGSGGVPSPGIAHNPEGVAAGTWFGGGCGGAG